MGRGQRRCGDVRRIGVVGLLEPRPGPPPERRRPRRPGRRLGPRLARHRGRGRLVRRDPGLARAPRGGSGAGDRPGGHALRRGLRSGRTRLYRRLRRIRLAAPALAARGRSEASHRRERTRPRPARVEPPGRRGRDRPLRESPARPARRHRDRADARTEARNDRRHPSGGLRRRHARPAVGGSVDRGGRRGRPRADRGLRGVRRGRHVPGRLLPGARRAAARRRRLPRRLRRLAKRLRRADEGQSGSAPRDRRPRPGPGPPRDRPRGFGRRPRGRLHGARRVDAVRPAAVSDAPADHFPALGPPLRRRDQGRTARPSPQGSSRANGEATPFSSTRSSSA